MQRIRVRDSDADCRAERLLNLSARGYCHRFRGEDTFVSYTERMACTVRRTVFPSSYLSYTKDTQTLERIAIAVPLVYFFSEKSLFDNFDFDF